MATSSSTSVPAQVTLMSRIRVSIQTRMEDKSLKNLNPLPSLEGSIWTDVETDHAVRNLYATIGRGFIDAIIRRLVGKALVESNYCSIENHELLSRYLASGEVSHRIMKAIRSVHLHRLPAVNIELPNVDPDDCATFLRVFVGAYATNAPHSLRGIRPWLINIYASLAEAGVKALNPNSYIVPRKRKAEAKAKGPRLSLAASTIDTSALGDVTNKQTEAPFQVRGPLNKKRRPTKTGATPTLGPDVPAVQSPIRACSSRNRPTATTTPKRPVAGSSKSPINISP
ncbi:hypothetical protein FB451DRAFT_1176157 [Mycena latifolia]|nr:hypothetical protein FB451DRAFT_1176157 [Mycena latifolia]